MILTNINDSGIATLALDRPEVHNAFNDETIAQIIETFSTWENNSKIRLVLIVGNGKSFCAGADLNWMKKMVDYSREENIKDSMNLAQMFKVINNFKRPVIGKVHGHALGGGAGLLAVCDHVIMAKEAKVGFTETRLGLVPAVISPYVINKIGESHARATFLSGQPFGGEKALQIGLAHTVCNRVEINEVTDKVVEQYLMAAPGAAQVAKQLIKDVLELSKNEKRDVYHHTCEVIASQRTSTEGQEGMKALLEKRKPVWPN